MVLIPNKSPKILNAQDHRFNILSGELIEFPMSGFIANMCPRLKLSRHRLFEDIRFFEGHNERSKGHRFTGCFRRLNRRRLLAAKRAEGFL